MRDEEATWLETLSILALWAACTLLVVFLTLVLYRAAHAAQVPVDVVAADVKLPDGGADYTIYRGHKSSQFERDAMEETLANIWLPQVVAYLRAMGKPCASYMSNAWSQIPVIYRRLAAVHQYRGGVLGGGMWQVTNGGRYYQIEHYQMVHARQCSLGNGAAQCALLLANTPELATLLDLHLDAGRCLPGALFVPPPPAPAQPGEGLVIGKQIFPILDAPSEAALKLAECAHMATMCGAAPCLDAAGAKVSLHAAQDAYIALAGSVSEAHFRMLPAFTGSCDPLWTPDECCRWKALEHREYTAWAAAERLGRWGQADCLGERHAHMHQCANLHGPFAIRMPPCVFGSYPDETLPVTCQQYLASPQP